MRISIEMDVQPGGGHDDFERALKPRISEALATAAREARYEMMRVRIQLTAPYRDMADLTGIAAVAFDVLKEHGVRMNSATIAMYVGKIAPHSFRRADQAKAVEDALHYRRTQGFPLLRDSDGKWYVAENGKE